LFADRLDDVVDHLDRLDHKTALQEIVARLGSSAPVYRTRSSGPDHDKTFHAVVEVDGRPLGEGVGRTKKAAEQIAAATAHGRLSADA
jgi:ribonuclease-3